MLTAIVLGSMHTAWVPSSDANLEGLPCVHCCLLSMLYQLRETIQLKGNVESKHLCSIFTY